MSDTAVNQLRVVLVTEDFDAAVVYYRDTLGLSESAAIAGPDGARVVILEAGRATLELANAAQARFIAEVETGGTPSTPVRLAFEVADVDAATAALAGAGAGAGVIAPPVRTPWNSRNARLDGPAGVQVTLFQELAASDGPAGLVGATLTELGGERGLLARTVELARRHGAAGQLPFVAVVVRDGTVIGAGANTTLVDHDPTAHGEVAAIRDATRRTGSPDLAGAVVYSSCEPCAICRTVAAAAGVREIVFAVGKEAVPAAIDPTPDLTVRLIDAVTAQLPGIARRGDAGLSAEDLTAPFRSYADAAGRG
ncbi:deaminase [Micromonospora globispora]|uniref:deaminase n=1 Tax=Micromonospora globispora TaxID=1450148 RepID=UPI001A9C46C8|nr:deaminase [Micromonospora globispora]